MVRREDIGFLDELSIDKLALVLLAISVFAVAELGLKSAVISARYGINVLTLATVEILSLAFGGLMFVVKAKRDGDVGFLPLVMIPVALRYAIPEVAAAFGVAASWSTDEVLDVALLMLLVACAEESFRAMFMAVSEQLGLGNAGQILVSNIAWTILHFVQRPPAPELLLTYGVWLFVTGLILSYIMRHWGLGAAILSHFLVNMLP